jgi:hypothetical protein
LCFNIFVISNKLILQDNVILGGQTFKIWYLSAKVRCCHGRRISSLEYLPWIFIYVDSRQTDRDDILVLSIQALDGKIEGRVQATRRIGSHAVTARQAFTHSVHLRGPILCGHHECNTSVKWNDGGHTVTVINIVTRLSISKSTKISVAVLHHGYSESRTV